MAVLAKVRSEAEIQAQLDARLAEIEAEGQKATRRFPCDTCRHRYYSYCRNPLVRGFDDSEPPNFDNMRDYVSPQYLKASLCGPEKALWQPRLSRWQKIVNRLAGLFGERVFP